MAHGGQTTVIQRILERRAGRPPSSTEETTASIAVLLRVVPAPKALIMCLDTVLRQQLERSITSDTLDYESVADEAEALGRFRQEFRPVVLTDSLEMVRKLRTGSPERTPFIVFFADLDDAVEREAGLTAGADECVGRRASAREVEARIASARRIAELETVLRITLAENRKLSATDDLTRVASRRFFSKNFPREIERAARYGRGLSLVLCDIDFFKKLNDTHGHAGGDQVLRQFAMRLQHNLRRRVDWVARIGGEEFAIVLPETPYEQALEVARKLRTAVGNAPYSFDDKAISVTASFGLCGLNRVPAGERHLAQRVLKIADAALYRSKHGGRNRVTATMFGGDP